MGSIVRTGDNNTRVATGMHDVWRGFFCLERLNLAFLQVADEHDVGTGEPTAVLRRVSGGRRCF